MTFEWNYGLSLKMSIEQNDYRNNNFEIIMCITI